MGRINRSTQSITVIVTNVGFVLSITLSATIASVGQASMHAVQVPQ